MKMITPLEDDSPSRPTLVEHPIWEGSLRRVMSWLALILIAAFSAFFFWEIAVIARLGEFDSIFRQHIAARVGLPTAAVASLSLVLVLQQSPAKYRLEYLGWNSKVRGGPTIMWAICFLGIALGIKLTWPLV